MTNGELFIRENPTVENKINGSCVWIYFDGVNHYTMPVSWWDKEIGLLDRIRAMIEQIADVEQKHDEKWAMGLRYAVKVIDKYRGE
jgi:hypothetical protein